MKYRTADWIIVVVAAVVICARTPGAAQEAKLAADSPANQSHTLPVGRTPDGQPDVQGKWESENTAGNGFSIETGNDETQLAARGFVGPPFHSVIIDPPGRVPYQPWALAIRNERRRVVHDPPSLEYFDTNARCYLYGMPHRMYRFGPRIIQSPGYVMMQWERDHDFRIIHVDGSPHVSKRIKLWNGDSRGRWEGDTLMVEVTNLNGYPWLDVVGDFISENTRIEERFKIVDADTIDYVATIIDPTIYTQPWKIGFRFIREKNEQEIWESACFEGNRFVENVLGGKPKQ